jgi:cobalt-zinc-cadmium resistance protein CzcA
MPQNSGDIFLIIKDQFKADAKSIANELNEIVKKQCLDCEISYTQPISMRFNEMLEGSRADLSLRIFGDDLEKLIIATKNIKKILHQFPEVHEVNQDFINSIRKGNFIDIIPNYSKIIQHQINLSDVNNDISNAMVGYQVGRYFATEYPISIILHLSEKNRHQIDSISSIPVALADGGSFPLNEVVSINEVEDIVSIPRLFGRRYSSLSIYLKNTEYEKFINKANQKISEEKILPQDYKIEWQGRFKNFNNGKRQILLVIPVIILAIFFILFKLFNNFKIVLLIFSSIPFALSGAIILLFIFSIKITISVYVGFIALIGISLLNSIILLDHLQKNWDIKKVCLQRLRPILMTAIVASLGFLPMAFAFGIGGEVQQPIAITVIGGIISSTISTLILTPILFNKFIIRR